MKNANYCCVNCQEEFENETDYINHYRSEHHRYNIKRKLIGLPPLSLTDFQVQFDDDKTSKESTHQELFCELCSKKFLSAGTYQAHLKSKKHKSSRDKIKAPDAISVTKSDSSSDFSVIGAEKPVQCIFCHEPESKEHLQKAHNFPPFKDECLDYSGLLENLHERIQEGMCIFCENIFTSDEAVKQHMSDVGHCKLDLENFSEYEKFYLWKIEQSSSEDDQSMMDEEKNKNSQSFIDLKKLTLEELEAKRMERIKYTTTGVIINGKEVGYREFKKYYKQYLGRQIDNPRLKYQPAIGSENNDWKNGYTKAIAPPRISQTGNCR